MENIQEPYLNNKIQDLEGEIWDSVVGFDGYYSVSNMGRVKSESRYTNTGQRLTGRVLKQKISTGNAKVTLSVDGIHSDKLVSNLVAETFLKYEKKEGFVVSFKNNNSLDCRLLNLQIITVNKLRQDCYDRGGVDLTNRVYREKLQLSKFGVYDGGILVKRICAQCFIETELTEFIEGYLFCKTCNLRRMGVIDVGRNSVIKELKQSGLKKCPKCQEIKKTDTQFWKGRSRCISCENERVLNSKNLLTKMTH